MIAGRALTNFPLKGITSVPERWLQYIEVQGEYIENYVLL
jgi:hypothetical protein